MEEKHLLFRLLGLTQAGPQGAGFEAPTCPLTREEGERILLRDPRPSKAADSLIPASGAV
jgi:hypothetical protein